MTIYRYGPLLLLLALLAGCGGDRLPALGNDSHILAFGDSLTEGKGVSRSASYPAVLQQLSGRTVINAGISGEVSADGLPRLQALLDEQSWDLLILMHGGNDILRNLNADTSKQNLAAMIDAAQARDIPVLLIGVPEKQLFSTSAPLYRELADEYRLVFIDDIISRLLKSPDYKSDQVHFNEAGYRKLAETILHTLQKNGAL